MKVGIVRRHTLLEVLCVVVVLRGDDPVSVLHNVVAADVEDHSLQREVLRMFGAHGIGAGLVLDAAIQRNRIAAVQRPQDQVLLIRRQLSPAGGLGCRAVHIVGIRSLIRVQTEHRPPAAHIQIVAVQTVHADDRPVVRGSRAGVTAIDRDFGVAVGDVLVPREKNRRRCGLKVCKGAGRQQGAEHQNDGKQTDDPLEFNTCF